MCYTDKICVACLSKNSHCQPVFIWPPHVLLHELTNSYRTQTDNTKQQESSSISNRLEVAQENDEVTWKLQLYPKGLEEDDTDYVALFLSLVSQDTAKTQVKVHCELSVSNSEVINCRSFTYTYETRKAWGYGRMIERAQLLKSGGPDNSVIVPCALDILGRVITKPVNPVSFDLQKGQLSEHFSVLFQDLHFSDITIIVGIEKFRAHKVVLAARSTVLAAMFVHKEMEENRTNEVKIEDLEPATVRAMLEFLYTDKVTDLETVACELLRVSDKYDLHRLRIMCEEKLYKTLSNDNAAEILTLSDLYHSHQLKEYVMRFIADHLLSVMQSESYKSMALMYPSLLNELLYSIAEKTSNFSKA